MGNLSYLLRAQGKLAEAEPDSREALAIRRRVLGNEHPKTLNAIINFGVLLMDQGKLAEAEPYCREVWEKRHRVLRDELPDTLLALYNLGRLLQALDKPTEVVELLAPAEPAARRAFTGGIAVHLGRFLTTLGRARTATSEFEAAETNLREAYAILIEPKGGTEGDRTDVLRGLVEFYNAWHAAEPDKGYDGQAAEWQVKLDEQQASAQPALP
jgi:tetratricopeptide (TPR) repeat protein